MTDVGKRRKKARPKKGSPKKGSPKRVPKKRVHKRAKPVPVPARTRTRTRKPSKRSTAAKKGWTTRRARAAREAREIREGLAHGPGDVEVFHPDSEGPRDDYQAYPIPAVIEPIDQVRWIQVDRHSYSAAMDWLEDRFGISEDHAADDGEIEWFPTFDEVYDYIDALVDEYDLDAHQMFELAFGYSDQDVA